MRSIAVRPSSFSRLRCWAGLSSSSNTTVSASSGLARAPAAPRPCPCRCRWRVGRLAALHDAADLVGAGGVDQQRQLVEAALGRPRRRRAGRVTPTRTIRSRNVRSISVSVEGVGQDRRSSPRRRGATERFGLDVATRRRRWPRRGRRASTGSPSSTVGRTARLVHDDRGPARPAPGVGGRGRGDSAGAAGLGVARAALPDPHRRLAAAVGRADELDVDAARHLRLDRSPSADQVDASAGSTQRAHEVRVAEVDACAGRSDRAVRAHSGVGPR